ncbi:RNA methyltransferase [Pochonia chlamydosporia 170]|uniref:rRNA methyltransferase 1, mitochondrial n=1 Tax=Pochonia chlamydosporia 170 TaxID=1380566 RepID=A0A179F9E5_METCM|nr:RNA methyltransferase [Pochonia chlamydosporia 170]OAQ62076.1 RNA methyltransferase [Pochonia chlamydosporia 170]
MISAKRWTATGSRGILHSTQFTPSTLVVPAFVRFASLSSIHRGLRRSERVQFGDSRPSRIRSDGQYQNYGRIGRTTKALDGAASRRQQQKLRKKLDRKASEAEDEEDEGRQTRRKRFLDPEFSFGKKSLVYQLKHGSLKDTAAALDLQDPVRPRRADGNDRLVPRSFRNVQSRPHPSNFHERRSRTTKDEDGAIDDATARPRRRGMMPMTIKYTTAASQFLYGRSVVKAALQQGRRQLYNLYVYGGDNRRDAKDNDSMINLAKSRGVPVTIVPNEDQRLMDKMSMGRPHNGFVLETSPLPQLPVKSLGKLEESPSKLGFNIELVHQTAEQKTINGENTFISKVNNSAAKPFVLLLHEILDPGNLGALLRTASYMGVDAVGTTSRYSSALTPVVLKSAAGAAEEVTIFTVDSPVEFLEDSRAAGWKTYAAVAPPEKKLLKIHGDKFISTNDIERNNPLDQHPCILVLGNEGHGLPRQVKVAADFELSVPRFMQGGSVDSLNVSVAAGLLCHTFVNRSATKDDDGLAQNMGESKPKEDVVNGGEALF